jgi:hypothetical protein
MATIVKEDEERPQISGNDGLKYASKYESVIEEKILRDEKQKEKHTIANMTLNEIVENTIHMVANFGSEYKKHIYKVNQDFKLSGDPDNFLNVLKQYVLAFIMYISEKDNILYFGIILCFLSIIIYFFNISTS